MKRIIEPRLLEWKEGPRRKPLVIRGARQVGKTYTVRHFGQERFKECVSVDLERNPAWHKVFERDSDPRRICSELEVLTGKRIIPGSTLLFIDEIQACPKALMSLRYFYEEMPGLHVVAAGSLLEFALGEYSFPVGRVQSMTLRPLCFAEYLGAIGKERQMELVLEEPHELPIAVHDDLLDELKRYFFIGGMPECVKVYAERGSMVEAYEVQAEICVSYRADFNKYKPSTDALLLNSILTSVVQSVGTQIKYSHLAEGVSHPTIKRGFDLLRMANVLQKVPSVNPVGLPLGASASEKIFKAILLDIGLMRYLSGMPMDVEFSKSDLLDIYRGALADQFVGQELLNAQGGELYCWIRRAQARSSKAEVDYVLVRDGVVHPLEVKSGSTGRLKSIQVFMNTYPASGHGLVFSMRPFGRVPERRLVMLPLYYVQSAAKSTGQDEK
jgi:hypothetical protein